MTNTQTSLETKVPFYHPDLTENEVEEVTAVLKSGRLTSGREIGVAKACLTGERCDRSPRTVGEFVGPGVKIACGDEWIIVNKLKVEGRYVSSADALKPGSRLRF